MTLTASDFLRNMADYMNQHGKCEGTATNAAGQVCTIGAESKVTVELIASGLHYNDVWHVGGLADKAINDYTWGEHGLSIVSWSDKNTETEVVKTFLTLADKLEFDNA